MSLVPIIRGKELMLVGDPQQLSPVILLDELTDRKLKRKYHVAEEYDYRKNSIYKTFLACDPVSDEVLLHNHYRCNEKIIEFNNKKYYNSKLNICSKTREEQPLIYVDVKGTADERKNVSIAEVGQILSYAKLHRDEDIGVITPFVNQRKAIEEAAEKAELTNLACGTVHAFQGDEKDVILFSTALTENTKQGTYMWLKNNKELINVATSRAKKRLIVLADNREVERLHRENEDDDLYELIQYVKTNGKSVVTQKQVNSRALGVKPFSTKTETAFLENLTHALENIWLSQNKYAVHKEVAISQVFKDNITADDLFYMGRFDFVVYEKHGRQEIPMLAIELDGKEHLEDEAVRERDRRKNKICEAHHLQIIRVENSYARRYNHIKDILLDYFSRMH
ncbi:MAG: AAA domain-containing protein, partial [Agathobacter sp.]|nr:AAA domain-containing protein [Agathobacter sp.]